MDGRSDVVVQAQLVQSVVQPPARDPRNRLGQLLSVLDQISAGGGAAVVALAVATIPERWRAVTIELALWTIFARGEEVLIGPAVAAGERPSHVGRERGPNGGSGRDEQAPV